MSSNQVYTLHRLWFVHFTKVMAFRRVIARAQSLRSSLTLGPEAHCNTACNINYGAPMFHLVHAVARGSNTHWNPLSLVGSISAVPYFSCCVQVSPCNQQTQSHAVVTTGRSSEMPLYITIDRFELYLASTASLMRMSVSQKIRH